MTNKLSSEQFSDKLKSLKLLLLDVDGVLTDGKLYMSESGQEAKCFNTLDGQGIKALRRSGVEVGIITGRKTALVANRAKDLGIHIIAQGREDKFDALKELIDFNEFPLDQIAFLGDDLPDLTVMTKVGLSLCVKNAHQEVAARAHWQTSRAGGSGAVREVCDLIMQAQQTYDLMVSSYVNN